MKKDFISFNRFPETADEVDLFEKLEPYAFGWLLTSYLRHELNKLNLNKMEKPQTLTAKFKLVTVTQHEGAEEPKLQPVHGDSTENKQWSAWTPGGDLRLYISNPQCFGFFDHDHEYYMELKKVAKPKKA